MKSLIIGGSGKIGKLLSFKDTFKTYYNNKINKGIKINLISDKILPILKRLQINRVLILSAMSDPDECLKKKKYSNLLNVLKTKEIINTLVKENIYFIFFSSEYIFDGQKGNYNEKSKVKPKNLYGKQKYQIEKYINKRTRNCSIFRIGKTYTDDINDNTLVSKILNEILKGKKLFSLASDQKFSPLFIKDLEKILKFFLKHKIKGTFNIGGPQQLSRFEVLKEIEKSLKEKTQIEIKTKKISLNDVNTLDIRPLNVTMNIKKLKKIIDFKLKTISNVSLNMINKNNAKFKNFKRR